MQNHFQRRRFIRSHDQAPCPATLPQETRTRRHAHTLGVDPGEVGVQPGEDLLALFAGERRGLKSADADGLPVR
jgi:hypothetical protein